MKSKKVLTNASWIVGCKLAQSGLAIIINALTARYFGPSNYGLISYAASLVAFVTPIMSLGISEILVNELIQNPKREGEIIGTSICMTFISSIGCIIGLIFFARISNPQNTETVLIVGLYSLTLVAQCLEQIQYWFHAKFLSKYVSLISSLAYVIISAYKLFLLKNEKSIYWFAVSTSLDYLLIAVGLFIAYRVKKGQALSFSSMCAKSLFNKGKHYVIPGLMGMVLAQSDKVMLRLMCDDASLGLYSAAMSLSAMTGFVFSAIITSFRPMILEYKGLEKEKYEDSMARLYGIVVYLSLLQNIFLSMFAQPIVNLMYGSTYQHAATILQVITWATTFSYIGGVRTVWVLAENKQQYLWIISLCGMIVNIAINAMLIPVLQALGAAIATLITQIITNIIMVYLIQPLRGNLLLILKGMNIKSIFLSN